MSVVVYLRPGVEENLSVQVEGMGLVVLAGELLPHR
jgi:hypothetical protein